MTFSRKKIPRKTIFKSVPSLLIAPGELISDASLKNSGYLLASPSIDQTDSGVVLIWVDVSKMTNRIHVGLTNFSIYNYSVGRVIFGHWIHYSAQSMGTNAQVLHPN